MKKIIEEVSRDKMNTEKNKKIQAFGIWTRKKTKENLIHRKERRDKR